MKIQWIPIWLILSLLFGGCATTQVAYKKHVNADLKANTCKQVLLLPIDIEISEMATGGMMERRDEWTASAVTNLTAELQRKIPGVRILEPKDLQADQALTAELNQVQALFRRIALNEMVSIMPLYAHPGMHHQPFEFGVGPLERLAKACGADAAIAVFVRDSYSTSGRKAIVAITMLAAASVGVGLVPQSAPTMSAAAMIHSDGTLLWYNGHRSSLGDLRETAGIKAFVEHTFQGLPLKAGTL